METCEFSYFLDMLKPWLDRDYIRKGYLGINGTFRIFFSDGGEKAYRIDDCTAERLKEIVDLMAAAGIPVEKSG
jgi:hypothetical protein